MGMPGRGSASSLRRAGSVGSPAGAVTTTVVKREKVVLVVRTVDHMGEILTLEGA